MKKIFLKKDFLSKIICIFSIQLLCVNIVSALDIDEKLTLRILKVSASKKTILINRGQEDGLVANDHASFYLTKGVVARGLVMQATPSRSVWSLYRVIDPDEIVANKVLKLKIVEAVKVTDDPSKVITGDAFVGAGSSEDSGDGVDSMLNGGDEKEYADKSILVGDEEKLDLAELKNESRVSAENSSEENLIVDDMPRSGSSGAKSLELLGDLYLNGLTTTVKKGNNSSVLGKNTGYVVGIAFEKYFFVPRPNFFRDLSINFSVHYASQNVVDNGVKKTMDAKDYGIGFNYHFINDPFSYNRLLPFFLVGAGIGTTTSHNGDSGSSNYFLSGFGAKYLFKNGVSIRSTIDYYLRQEKYVVESPGTSYNVVNLGPRMLVGLSYRW